MPGTRKYQLLDQVAVSGFSDDGQWWWDGERWLATSEVVLPDLPMTEFERSGKLKIARRQMAHREWLMLVGVITAITIVGLSVFLPFAVAMLVVQRRAFKAYRLWTLDQLALATTFLLGADEPMLAGETTLCSTTFFLTIERDYAVAVTGGHVLIFRIESLHGQPRWLALAARCGDVQMYFSRGLFTQSKIVVTQAGRVWAIRGDYYVFQPIPVFQAWSGQVAPRTPRPQA